MDRDLWAEERHFSLHQAEGQGPVMQAIKHDYNNKSKKEKQVKGTVSNMEPELASFLQHF